MMRIKRYWKTERIINGLKIKCMKTEYMILLDSMFVLPCPRLTLNILKLHRSAQRLLLRSEGDGRGGEDTLSRKSKCSVFIDIIF